VSFIVRPYMGRLTKAVLGCAVSWVVGCAIGTLAAKLYERWMYPPELGPVHFDVGGVFLLVWVFAGAAGSCWFLGRAGRAFYEGAAVKSPGSES
jgi:hypothetical protein